MEEKQLLQQITFLSRLIGQHKDNSQQRNQINFRRQTIKGQNTLYKHNMKFVRNSANERGPVVYPSCKSTTNHVPFLPEQISRNTSKYKKINTVNYDKSFIPDRQISERTISQVRSSGRHIFLHGSQHSGVEIRNTGSHEMISITSKTLKTEMRTVSSPKTSLSTESKIKADVSKTSVIKPKQNLLVPNVNIEGRVSVHINPQFLERESLSCLKGRINDCQSVPTTSVVHVNPRLLEKIMTSSQENVSAAPELTTDISEQMGNKLAFPCVNVSKVSEASIPKVVQHKENPVFCSRRKLVNAIRPKSPHPVISNVRKIVPSNVKSTNLAHRRMVKNSQNNMLLTVSPTKLIRVPSRSRRTSVHKISHQEENKVALASCGSPGIAVPFNKANRRHALKVNSLSKFQRSFIPTKISPSIKMARLVCSKYKLRNLPTTSSSKPKVASAANKVVSNSLTKYKIDRRHQRIKQFKNVKKYSLKYDNVKSLALPKRYSALKNKGRIFVSSSRHLFNNKVWSISGVRKSGKIVMSHRKLSQAGNNTDPRRRKKPEPNSALVRIGEFFYKTSRTKLTRSKVEGSSILQSKLTAGTSMKKRKCNCGHIVYVRGIKFVMDPLGKTLKRIHDTSSVNDNGQPAPMKPNLMKRVDIGGFTFVQKSSDLLMRTNTHNTRAFMSQAKQRSIALLTKKMRKNNQPCMIYHRFGKCNRYEKGTCQMVHDPKHIAICRKFLLGQCNVTGCLLSHNVIPEKMPTCKYFLEGCCVRDSCPYLHVKVSAKAEICLKFLQGYCSDGPKCKKRHVYLCPEFDRKGSCRKGKYCPYPHQTGGKKDKVIPKKAKLSCKKSVNTGEELEPSRERYYQSKTCQSENKFELVDINNQNKKRVNPVERSKCDSISPLSQSIYLSEESDDEPRIKRPKLGKLPSYIALDSEKNHPEENLI